MATYALVRDSDAIVVGLADYEKANSKGWVVPKGHSLRIPKEPTKIGATYEAPEELTLDELKREKLFEVSQQHDDLIDKGFSFTHDGEPRVASLSVSGVQIIMAIYALGIGTVMNDSDLLASLSIPPVEWPKTDVPYKTADGTYIVLTRPQAFALAVGAFNRVAAIRFRRGMLDMAIQAAVDDKALDLIDPADGWPE